MGLFKKSCYTYPKSTYTAPGPEQPDPTKFTVMRSEISAHYALLEVVYPNCTNFEGRKIILMYITPAQLRGLKSLDPHFQEDGRVLARYAPTELGWTMGMIAYRTLVFPVTSE